MTESSESVILHRKKVTRHCVSRRNTQSVQSLYESHTDKDDHCISGKLTHIAQLLYLIQIHTQQRSHTRQRQSYWYHQNTAASAALKPYHFSSPINKQMMRLSFAAYPFGPHPSDHPVQDCRKTPFSTTTIPTHESCQRASSFLSGFLSTSCARALQAVFLALTL